MSEFFDMGGYAAFVWPSYGVSFVILAGLLLLSLRDTKSKEAEVERLRALGADQRRNTATEAQS
jgi:heme exporter protein D